MSSIDAHSKLVTFEMQKKCTLHLPPEHALPAAHRTVYATDFGRQGYLACMWQWYCKCLGHENIHVCEDVEVT